MDDPDVIVTLKRRASRVDPAWMPADVDDDLWDAASLKVKHQRRAMPLTIEQTSKWKTFISRLKKESKLPEIQVFDPTRKFDIEDVQRVADAAIEADADKGKWRNWRKNPLRVVGHSVNNNASTLEALIKFLPDTQYTFIICGALSLLLTAAKQYRETCSRVIACLSSLRQVVESVRKYLLMYEGDPELERCAENLYVVLLISAEDLLTWINKSTHRKFFSALARQESYGNEVDDKIKNGIEQSVMDFHEIAQVCIHKRIMQIDRGNARIEDGVADSGKKLDSLGNSVGNLMEEMKKKNEESNRKDAAIISLGQMLYESMREMQWLRFVDRSRQPLVVNIVQNNFLPPPVLPPAIKAEQLLELLAVEKEIDIADLQKAFVTGRMFSSHRKARAVDLMQNISFQEWLKLPSSHMIAVNGRERDKGWDKRSPLSYFTALLVRTLGQMEAVPLTFLCGEHTTRGDPIEGGKGIMRSLCAQLLQIFGDKLNLSLLDSNFLEVLGEHDLASLCDLFQSLLRLAAMCTGACVVFVVLDGISFYEIESRVQDLDTVITCLRDLVEESKMSDGSLTLKVMVTSPMSSKYAKQWLEDEAVIDMRDDILDHGDGYDGLEYRDDPVHAYIY